MKIVFGMSIILLTLFSCVSVSDVEEVKVPLLTETLEPPIESVETFTITPSPYPTLSDFYYSDPSPFNLLYIKMVDEFRGWGWVGNYDGVVYRLVRTSDGGKSWVDVTPIEQLGVTRFFILDSKTIWVSDVKSAVPNFGRSFYATNDGGKTWNSLSVPPDGIHSLHFADENTGWAAHINLYKTIDGGETWNIALDTPLVEDDNFLVRENNNNNIWISNYYVGGASFKYLYVSWDGGESWEEKILPFQHELFSDSDLERVHLPIFFDDGLGYVTAQYRRQMSDDEVERLIAIFATKDGGQTWKQRSFLIQGLPMPDYVDFVSSDIVIAACGYDLCISRDGAQTWQIVPLYQLHDGFFASIDMFDMDFVSEKKGWILTWKIGVGTNLYFTEDGGVTWAYLPIIVNRKD